MATQEWNDLRSYVESMSREQLVRAASCIGERITPEQATPERLRKLAYQYSRTNYAFSDAARGYAAVHNKMKGALADADYSDAMTKALTAPEPASSTEPAIVPALADKIATPGLDVDAIKKLIRAETKDLRVLKIEIVRDGDKVATLTGLQHNLMPLLLKAAASRQVDGYHPNIWLAGPPGSGKTHAARALSLALCDDFQFNGALSMAHEVLGFVDAAGKYHETAFYRGFIARMGYLFDECDGSDNAPLLALNAALANGHAMFPMGLRERHIDSLIIAGANTFGLGATADFVGRTKIDAAFLDRFPVKIFWDYDATLETAICGNAEWSRRVQRARAAARSNGLKVMITPRASIAGAALIASGFSSNDAAKLTYHASLTADQIRMVG